MSTHGWCDDGVGLGTVGRVSGGFSRAVAGGGAARTACSRWLARLQLKRKSTLQIFGARVVSAVLLNAVLFLY